MCIRDRLSTYLNALADAGFRIERVVEQTDAATLGRTGALDDKTKKARLLPLSFVIKARKQS